MYTPTAVLSLLKNMATLLPVENKKRMQKQKSKAQIILLTATILFAVISLVTGIVWRYGKSEECGGLAVMFFSYALGTFVLYRSERNNEKKYKKYTKRSNDDAQKEKYEQRQ